MHLCLCQVSANDDPAFARRRSPPVVACWRGYSYWHSVGRNGREAGSSLGRFLWVTGCLACMGSAPLWRSLPSTSVWVCACPTNGRRVRSWQFSRPRVYCLVSGRRSGCVGRVRNCRASKILSAGGKSTIFGRPSNLAWQTRNWSLVTRNCDTTSPWRGPFAATARPRFPTIGQLWHDKPVSADRNPVECLAARSRRGRRKPERCIGRRAHN